MDFNHGNISMQEVHIHARQATVRKYMVAPGGDHQSRVRKSSPEINSSCRDSGSHSDSASD